ncbi:MAG: hypothetical protein ACREOW_13035 [Thermodesulfobacteriota bacterium]
MNMPGFSAEEALYNTKQLYIAMNARNSVAQGLVRIASFALDFDPSTLYTDPRFELPRWKASCGPCECTRFGSGIFTGFSCWQECWINWYVPGREELSTRYYQRCFPWRLSG